MRSLKKTFMLLALLLSAGVGFAALPHAFDNDWLFHLGEIAAGEKPNLNDKSWRTVDLPHDWSIEGAPDKDNPAGNDGGYYPTGIGWYRKHFQLKDTDKLRWIYFEGVYENATIYINGVKVAHHPYGYTSFFTEISPHVRKGDNVLAVKVDNSQQKNCRWYSGSGIYRHVRLIEKEALHIDNWGVQVMTPDLQTAVIRTTIVNAQDKEASLTLSIKLAGQEVQLPVTVEANQAKNVEQVVHVKDAKAWSVEHPCLYTTVISLRQGKQCLDTEKVRFGFRTIAYSAESGLLLNGKPIKLNGGCVHHDNGILGAAAYNRAEEWKAEMMKAAGYNAARTSHNPPSEAFLDACDRIGLLVIDEAFDGWREEKNKYDYHLYFDEWSERDIESMVRRDRNHPSVFCWSIGNEIIERKKIEAVTTARRLANAVKQHDKTRPVTSALASWDKDWEIYDPLAEEHDIVGYNYMIHKAATDHQRDPRRVMMQTESYPRDAFSNWKGCMDNSYRIGDFVWTAIDYLGESGIGRYWYEGEVPGEHYARPLFPCHAAYCGDIDLTGWRKPISHYRNILWQTGAEKEDLYMAVREPDGYYGKINTGLWAVWPTWESWNWEGWEGKEIEVEVYSRTYPSIRLFLNDKLVGEMPTTLETQYKATFKLPYQPGTLRAVPGNAEQPVCSLTTAGQPAGIKLAADKQTIDTEDLCFVTIEMVDAQGNICANDTTQMQFSVKGAGKLLAAGNADIKDKDRYTDTTHKLWKARALAIMRSGKKNGQLTLTASAPGLPRQSIKVYVKGHDNN